MMEEGMYGNKEVYISNKIFQFSVVPIQGFRFGVIILRSNLGFPYMSGVFGTFFKDLDFLGPTWNHLRVLIVVKTKYQNLGPSVPLSLAIPASHICINK